jgi:hypothetical protein
MEIQGADRNGKQRTLRQMQQRRRKDAYGESEEGWDVLIVVVPHGSMVG